MRLKKSKVGTSASLSAGLFALAASFSALAQIEFAPAVSYPIPITGDGPEVLRSLAAGDWDGDGDLDLAVGSGSDEETSTIWILLNHGDGTFDDPLEVPAGRAPMSIAVGDLDGNGTLDLAIANGDPSFKSITVLLNNGNDDFGVWLGFAAPADYPSGKGQDGQNAIAVGDLDGDGYLDIATANRQVGTVSLLVNNGDGTFADPIIISVAPFTQRIITVDLDDDGDLDLATANIDIGPGSVSVLLNEGGMRFAEPVNYPVGVNPNALVAGDWDHDGDYDLAVPNSQGGISVLLNEGDGTFGKAGGPRGGDMRAISAADFNGDGDLDLAAAVLSGSNDLPGFVGVFVNEGAGTFSPAGLFEVGRNPRSLTATGVDRDGNLVPLDLDGDGDADVATGNRASSDVSVLLNETTPFCFGDLNEDGSVGVPDLLILLGFWGPCSPVCLGDLDGDDNVGVKDLLILLANWGPCP